MFSRSFAVVDIWQAVEKAVKRLFREALPHAKASVPCKSGCFAMGSAIFGAISPMETDFLPFFAATAMGALQVLPFRKVFDRPEVWIIFTACCVCCVLILRPCPAFTNAETWRATQFPRCAPRYVSFCNATLSFGRSPMRRTFYSAVTKERIPFNFPSPMPSTSSSASTEAKGPFSSR